MLAITLNPETMLLEELMLLEADNKRVAIQSCWVHLKELAGVVRYTS